VRHSDRDHPFVRDRRSFVLDRPNDHVRATVVLSLPPRTVFAGFWLASASCYVFWFIVCEPVFCRACLDPTLSACVLGCRPIRSAACGLVCHPIRIVACASFVVRLESWLAGWLVVRTEAWFAFWFIHPTRNAACGARLRFGRLPNFRSPESWRPVVSRLESGFRLAPPDPGACRLAFYSHRAGSCPLLVFA